MNTIDPAPRLQFNLLGPPEIHLDGVICHDPAGVKDRALLFYLATTERNHSRQALAALLWGDKPEGLARANLRKSLQRLQAFFGDFLRIDPGPPYHVGLHAATDWWVDTAALISGTETGNTDSGMITEALALYQGDFLSGFFVRGAPDFEAWMFAERARLRELFQQRLRALIAWCEEQAELDTAILLCRRILELEPWREEIHRLLMRLHFQNGDRGNALAQYRICVETLRRELDVPPDKATNDLIEQILNDPKDRSGYEASLKPIQELQPQPLPIPRTSFVGREQELRDIAQRLQEPHCRLLTIAGPGGVGKTRLALAVAEQNKERYRDGAWYVPMAVVDSPDYIPSAIASSLGIALEGSGHAIDQVVAHLQEREMLLVLDNFEHLLPDVSHLMAILDAAPNVTVLVTSRERLQLYVEHCYEVSGLPASEPVQDGDATQSDAVQLFLQRAEQQRVGFRPAEEDIKTIVQICALVEGLPLGIELAASWIGVLSCPLILRELLNNLNDFPANLRDISERHRSLSAVIQHSWKLLSSPERRVLRGLAIFQSGFDLEAAKAVTDASILQLSLLIRKSLLQMDSERYRLHESVRQYAEHQLQAAGEEADIREKHLRYFISLARTGNDALLTAEQIQWLLRLEQEHDNLRTALSWSHNSTQIPDAGSQLIGNLGWYWYFGGHWQEGYAWVEKVLGDRAQYDATEQYIKALYIAGGLATALDRYDQATLFLHKAVEIGRQIDDRTGLAFALSIATFTFLYTGQYREAKAAALDSVAIFEELHHQPGYWWALGALGEVLLFSEEYEEARTVFEKCVHEQEQIGITTLLPHALVHLGKAERYLDDYECARTHLREGLIIARNVRAPRFAAQALHGLGMLALYDGDVVSAAASLREAMILFHRLGDGMGLADCLDTAATVFVKADQHEIGARVFGACDAFRHEIGVPTPVGDRHVYTESIQILLQVLDRETFDSLWSDWRAVPHQQVVSLCIDRLSGIA